MGKPRSILWNVNFYPLCYTDLFLQYENRFRFICGDLLLPAMFLFETKICTEMPEKLDSKNLLKDLEVHQHQPWAQSGLLHTARNGQGWRQTSSRLFSTSGGSFMSKVLA